MHPLHRAFASELVKVGARAARSTVTSGSSNVRGFRYDAAAKQLFVTYKSGGTYRYDDVPAAAAAKLGRAKSVGKAVHQHVKAPGYAYQKVAAPAIVSSLIATRRHLAKLAGVAKSQVTWGGLTMKIEYEPGDIRTGVSRQGDKWERKMYDSYGYVPGTKGKADDGDAIDVYFSHEPVEGPVYKIDQLKKDDGEHDEDKFFVGYSSAEEAKKAYLRHMPEWAFGGITQVGKTFEDFKTFVSNL